MFSENEFSIFDFALCMSEAIDLVFPLLNNHHKKVAYISYNIAREMGLPDEDLKDTVLAALLHDIGAFTIEERAEIIAALFEDSGIVFDIAENGRKAVELFTANPERYDMIFMDVQMPEMDGLTATGHIRAAQAPNTGLPIIAMTANAFKEDIEKCFEAGMNDHLAKPIDEKAVIEKIAHYAKRS